MGYGVTSIVYASRPKSQGAVTQANQILLIFGKVLDESTGNLTGNEVLLWRGRTNTFVAGGNDPNAIEITEWESGSWNATFEEGETATDQTTLTPIDTSTASVSAHIVKNSVLSFEYAAPGGSTELYRVLLTNYVYAATPMRREPGIAVDIVDYVPAEVGLNDNRDVQAFAEYDKVASYRRPVIYEYVHIESFDVQLTGPKQFTATFSGTVYLVDTQNISSRVDLRLYAKELDGETVAESTIYTLSPSYGTASGGSVPFSGSLVLTDKVGLIGYDLAKKYRFYADATIDSETVYETETLERWTQRKLTSPAIDGMNALDGVGSVRWGAVENAAGYRIALVDSKYAIPASSSSATSPWSFDETSSGTVVQGKYVRLQSVAVSTQYEYANSEWSEGVLIPDNRTPDDQEEEPVTPVEMIMTRRIYKAIPYIDVPVEQIGGGGSSKKDVATIEYLEANYVKSSGEIPASQLPFAVYGTTDDDSETTVVNPAYVKGAIDDINQVYAITDIQIASNSLTKFAGVATSVTSTAEDYTLITRKGVYDFARNASNLGTGTVDNARLNKAKAAGGSGNAGIVWVNATAGNDGLVISSASGEEGLIKVNFAAYGTTGATDTHTVVNPSYLESRITALGLGTAAGYAVGTAQGNIPVLGANGKLSIDMMPARVIGGEYLGEVASATAMVGKTGATVGDFVKRTDTGTYWMLGVDADGAYATADNWFEYAGAVTSVNGAVGAVTQAQLGLETTLTATSDTAFPSSKAVATYVTGQGYLTSGSNLNASKLSSGTVDAARLPWSLATWTDGTTHYSTTGNGLVTQTYLSNAFTDYGFGAAAKKGVATTVTSGGTDLVTSDGVYSYIAGLNLSSTYAEKTHTHTLGNIIYDGTTGYAAGTSISSSSTDGQLATALAVYSFVDTNYAPKTHNHTSSQISDSISTAAGITTDATGLVQGKAVRLYINSLGLGDASKKGVATSITASEAGLTPGSLVYSYAAPKTHSHTSSQISDAINSVSDPSESATFAKVVKTENAWGQISATLVPVDEDSIVNVSGALSVSNAWFHTTGDVRYLKKTDAPTQYVKMLNTGAGAWTSGVSYGVGDLVYTTSGQLWRCIQTNTATESNGPAGLSNTDPGGNYVYWKPATLAVDTRFDTTITGDGSTTEFTVTHGLGTKDVEVSLIDDSTDQEVFAAVTMYSATQVKIGFGAAPASGKKYRVVVRR